MQLIDKFVPRLVVMIVVNLKSLRNALSCLMKEYATPQSPTEFSLK